MNKRAKLWALGLILAGGCEAGGEDQAVDDAGEIGETGGPSVDEDAVVAAALAYADYEAINAPTASAHGLADTVVVWVPSEWADLYRGIDPDDPDASAEFPTGALIIKEHLDEGGQASGLTVMYKAASGFDPEHDDWWWANASLDGTLNDSGTVGYCIDCHQPRVDADWVFGIAAADQL